MFIYSYYVIRKCSLNYLIYLIVLYNSFEYKQTIIIAPSFNNSVDKNW